MSNNNPELHLENLIPLTRRTTKEKQRIASMGGKASQNSQKKTKLLNKLALIIGQMEFSNEEFKKEFEKINPELPKNISMNTALMMGQFTEAIKGNSKSAIFIRDTMGEKPVDKVANTDSEGQDVPIIKDDI